MLWRLLSCIGRRSHAIQTTVWTNTSSVVLGKMDGNNWALLWRRFLHRVSLQHQCVVPPQQTSFHSFISKHQWSSTATMSLDPGSWDNSGWVDCADWVCPSGRVSLRTHRETLINARLDLIILGSGCVSVQWVASELGMNDDVVLGYICLVKNLALG